MTVPAVTNFFEAVMVSLAAAMMTLLVFVPGLVGAVILLVIGWFVSSLVARGVLAVLDRAGFESAALKTGISGFITRAGIQDPRAGVLLADLVKWFIRLIFLEAAAQAIHLQALTEIINRIILFIPNLVVAIAVLMVGAILARLIAGAVRGAADEAGLASPDLLAALARYAIIAFAVLVAINQIGIAANLVNALFIALVGALALALGLAFGLGGRDVAALVWRGWYDRSQELGPHLQAAAQQRAAAGQAADEPVTTGQPITPGMAPAAGTQARPETAPEPRQRMRPTLD